MSIRRAEWTWPRYDAFRTREGYWIDLRDICPADVGHMIRKDVQAVTWKTWTSTPEYSSLAPAPLMEPIRQQLRARTGLHRALTRHGRRS